MTKTQRFFYEKYNCQIKKTQLKGNQKAKYSVEFTQREDDRKWGKYQVLWKFIQNFKSI